MQNPPDVAQHAARLQRAERDDLCDLVATILLLHVANDLVAPVLTEVDVEIRHRNPLGIEKALEQQTETDRIEIGDGQRVSDQRAGAGAAARSDRDVLRLSPLDEIGNDQEIAGIVHVNDDAELEFEPLAIILDAVARRGAVARQAPFQTRSRGAAELLSFGILGCVLARLCGIYSWTRLSRARASTGGEARQDRRQSARPEDTALRNFRRSRQRLRQVGK